MYKNSTGNNYYSVTFDTYNSVFENVCGRAINRTLSSSAELSNKNITYQSAVEDAEMSLDLYFSKNQISCTEFIMK